MRWYAAKELVNLLYQSFYLTELKRLPQSIAARKNIDLK